MKTVHICEKCGKQFESWDECYACEESHIDNFSSDFDPELRSRYQYKPGNTVPEKVLLAHDESRWNGDTQNYEHTYKIFAYKFVGEISEPEKEKIIAEKVKREADAEASWQRYLAERERKQAEQEAKEQAEQEPKTEQETA